MYNELVNINKEGNVFLQDDSIALMSALWAVYKHKNMGSNMVKWIVAIYDHKSPFRRLPLDERIARVTYLYFEKDKHPRENDKLVKDAIDEYIKLQYDPLIDEYNAMCEQSFKMTKLYRSIEPTESNLEDLNTMQEKMGKSAKSRDAIKALILKDQESESKISGTGSEDFSVFENDERIGM